MKAEEIKRKFREHKIASWSVTIIGFALMTGGAYRFFFLKAEVGVNVKTLLPVVSNGSIGLVVGLILFAVGFYRLLNSRKVFKQEMEINRDLGRN